MLTIRVGGGATRHLTTRPHSSLQVTVPVSSVKWWGFEFQQQCSTRSMESGCRWDEAPDSPVHMLRLISCSPCHGHNFYRRIYRPPQTVEHRCRWRHDDTPVHSVRSAKLRGEAVKLQGGMTTHPTLQHTHLTSRLFPTFCHGHMPSKRGEDRQV